MVNIIGWKGPSHIFQKRRLNTSKKEDCLTIHIERKISINFNIQKLYIYNYIY
jgi:hypothetical protein